jgi:hypothetical protein
MKAHKLWQVGVIAALGALGCGGAPHASAPRVEPGAWYELRFVGAALPARRASGAAWHQEGSDRSASVLGGLLGLAVGYPEIGLALGSALSTEPEPEAPAPMVVVKIEGDEYELAPIGQTLAPRWTQPIAIPAARYRADAQVILQIRDAIDDGVIGQRSMTVGELLQPGARTLTELGEVASLDVAVRAMPARAAVTFELYVDGTRSLEELKNGADRRWAPVPVWNGDRVTVRASGEICPSRPTPCFDAAGAAPGKWSSYNYQELSQARHASLVGLLPGQAIELGAEASVGVAQAGFLLLFVNDTDEGNNSGGFDVQVTVEPAR